MGANQRHFEQQKAEYEVLRKHDADMLNLENLLEREREKMAKCRQEADEYSEAKTQMESEIFKLKVTYKHFVVIPVLSFAHFGCKTYNFMRGT